MFPVKNSIDVPKCNPIIWKVIEFYPSTIYEIRHWSFISLVTLHVSYVCFLKQARVLDTLMQPPNLDFVDNYYMTSFNESEILNSDTY